MEFDPNNTVIKLCVQGMDLEQKGDNEQPKKIFMQAWKEAKTDFEKFIAAHYVTRHQTRITDKVRWMETGLEFALKTTDEGAKGALPTLYRNLSRSYEELGDQEKAKKYR